MTTYSKTIGLLTVLLTGATAPMIAVGQTAADPVATAQQQAAVQVDSNRAWLREQEKRSADLHQNTPVPEFLRQ